MAERTMQRVAVVGPSGAGKTTLGRRLAERVEGPLVELDAIFHQPGWEPLPLDRFRQRVAEIVATERWVIDGNYSGVQDLVWTRADTVVWLDLPRSLVIRRLTQRTLRRAITREELWNGNREPLTGIFRLDPDRNIVCWSWQSHPRLAERYGRAAADPANRHLRIVRLRSPREIERFLV